MTGLFNLLIKEYDEDKIIDDIEVCDGLVIPDLNENKYKDINNQEFLIPSTTIIAENSKSKIYDTETKDDDVNVFTSYNNNLISYNAYDRYHETKHQSFNTINYGIISKQQQSITTVIENEQEITKTEIIKVPIAYDVIGKQTNIFNAFLPFEFINKYGIVSCDIIKTNDKEYIIASNFYNLYLIDKDNYEIIDTLQFNTFIYQKYNIINSILSNRLSNPTSNNMLYAVYYDFYYDYTDSKGNRHIIPNISLTSFKIKDNKINPTTDITSNTATTLTSFYNFNNNKDIHAYHIGWGIRKILASKSYTEGKTLLSLNYSKQIDQLYCVNDLVFLLCNHNNKMSILYSNNSEENMNYMNVHLPYTPELFIPLVDENNNILKLLYKTTVNNEGNKEIKYYDYVVDNKFEMEYHNTKYSINNNNYIFKIDDDLTYTLEESDDKITINQMNKQILSISNYTKHQTISNIYNTIFGTIEFVIIDNYATINFGYIFIKGTYNKLTNTITETTTETTNKYVINDDTINNIFTINEAIYPYNKLIKITTTTYEDNNFIIRTALDNDNNASISCNRKNIENITNQNNIVYDNIQSDILKHTRDNVRYKVNYVSTDNKYIFKFQNEMN